MPQPKSKKTETPEGWEPVESTDTSVSGWEPVESEPTPPLPNASMSAAPKAGTLPWVKAKANTLIQKGLDLLPTAGGIVGGIAGGGAGLETGPGAIATGAAGAAAGGGLGEVLKQEGEELLFPNRPKMTPKESAKGIAKEVGIQGISELTGRAAGKLLSPAIKFFGKTADESAKAGVKMLPSEASGKAPSYAEKFLKGSVLTSGKMDKFREMQNAQTKEAVDKIADQISSFKGTPEQLGQKVQEGVEQHVKQFRVLQKQLYDDIGKQVNERTIKIPVVTSKQVPTGLLDQYGRPTFNTSTTTTLTDKIVDDVMPSTVPLKKFAAEELKKLDQVGKVLDPNLLSSSKSMLQTLVDAPNNMPYSAMRAARSDTLAKVRELDQALAGKQAGLAKKMAELFDDSIMDAVKKSKIPGLEQDVRAADAFTANEHKMFEQQLVKKVVDTKKPEAIATLIRGKSIGNDETRDLFKILPKSLHQPVQRQIIVDTMRQATNNISKAFNERKFAETIGAIGDERGQIIFGPNWKNIKELTGIMERINGPVGLQGGAGAALQNFSILKNAMLAVTPFGFAEKGQYGAAAGSLAAEWASLNALASAMTHPATAVKILKVARQVISKAPYAVTGAVSLAGGPKKSLEQIKAEAQKLQTPPPQAPATHPDVHFAPDGSVIPGPQSSAKPAKPNWTHVYDEAKGEIVPV